MCVAFSRNETNPALACKMRSSAYDAIWVNTPHLDLEQLAFAPLFGAVFPRATTAPPYTLLPIVQQQFLFSLPTHQSNKVESVTKPKQWPTFSITWTKKKKRKEKNTTAIAHSTPPPKYNLPPPIHTLTSHKHLIDCALSSHTKAVRNITLIF